MGRFRCKCFEVAARFQCKVTGVVDVLERLYDSVEVDGHGKRNLMGIVPAVVIVDMQRLQTISECADHVGCTFSGTAHFCMSDIQAGNEKVVVYDVEVLVKACRGRTCRERGLILFRVSAPHIFGCDFNAAFFCKRQQIKVHFRVFLGGQVVVRMDDADFAACLCGAFQRAF